MKLRYTTPAARDLDRILTYLAERSPQGARHVQARIEATINLLLEHPKVGQPTSRRGMRRIVVSPYPYLIFYRESGEAIIVHAIHHGARNPGVDAEAAVKRDLRDARYRIEDALLANRAPSARRRRL